MFLSRKEADALKEVCKDRIGFFNHEYHSARVSMKHLCLQVKHYAVFAKGEMKKAEESVKFWEEILKKLG